VNAPGTGTASAAELDAARLLLARMGISPAELLATAPTRPPAPTFAEYVPVVSAAVGDGTRRVYGSYWNRVVDHWGDRRLDEATPSQIAQLCERLRAERVLRRNARGGRSTTEHLIAALRCLYNHAVADGWIGEADNPARKVPKPRRLPSTRRAVAHDRLAEINQVAATTGNDPALDSLLIRLHTETACRRGGALALRPSDLDVTQCLILLREKGETSRWQPVSPTLMRHLLQHADERGAAGDGQLLRYANGAPITRRRYDHLWKRIGQHLPWAAAQGISTHWLRHTTLTWVERAYGHAVAREYAGHTEGGGNEGTTGVYVRATQEEVAAALCGLASRFHASVAFGLRKVLLTCENEDCRGPVHAEKEAPFKCGSLPGSIRSSSSRAAAVAWSPRPVGCY
jgi:integrase/recombinase XerC